MPRSNKFIIFLAAICLGLNIGLTVLAQDSSATADAKLDEEVKAENLDIKEPTILPDSRLYFLKEWGRGIQSFFAFGQLKKTELEQKFANERLIELKALVEKNGDPKILEKATEKYEKTMEKIAALAEKIKQKAGENENVSKFLDKFTKQQLLQEKILQKLEDQVPPAVYQKIKEAREKHLERFAEVMTKLENRIQELQKRLEEQTKEISGSKFKDFKNLETLKELEEKVPEQAKEAIQKAQENVLKRLQNVLDKMATSDQEIFQDYIEQLSGNKDRQVEILDNLKLKIQEKTTEIKEGVEKTRVEQIQERIKQLEELRKSLEDQLKAKTGETQ